MGWGERGGGHKLTSKGCFLTPILNFGSPLTKSFIYMCPTRNHCITVKQYTDEIKYRKFKLKKTKDEKCIFYKKSELNLALTHAK